MLGWLNWQLSKCYQISYYFTWKYQFSSNNCLDLIEGIVQILPVCFLILFIDPESSICTAGTSIIILSPTLNAMSSYLSRK